MHRERKLASVKKSGRLSHWVVLMARAVPAIVVAILITFTADHSTGFGFAVVGGLAVATGAVILRGSFIPGLAAPGARRLHAAVLLVGGVGALALIAAPVSVLLFLILATFGVSGIVELTYGIRSRDRESTFLGALSAALAVAALVVPADYALSYVVNNETHVLTAAVMIVGIVGVFAAISGVYLVIAALSHKWTEVTPNAAIGSEAS
jgi:uncharacterized membrane protein HdeD (DUF308 family)